MTLRPLRAISSRCRKSALRRSRHVVPALVAAPLALLAACAKTAAPPPAAPLPVSAAVATVADVPVEWRGVGTLEPVSNVAVRAQVGGRLEQVHFTEGQEVKKGNLLFTLDSRPFQTALDAAQAQLARDQALADNAAADATRYAELAKKEYVTAEEYEAKRSSAAALDATLGADRAAIERARLDLGYCAIRAPLAGRTGSLQVYAGNLVKANDDTPMVVIQQMDPIRVRFAVPQQLLPEIRKGSATAALGVAVSVAGAAPGTDPRRGELSFIDNAIDGGSGTIALKATFPNGDAALWPGQFVQVVLTLSQLENAVVAPSTAIQTGQDGDYVYVIASGGAVESRPVELGPVAGDKTVIRTGLAVGETVVTEGQLRLFPGAKVEVQTPAAGTQ